MEKILLYPVQESKDLSKILEIQKEAFEPLYLKYIDTEISPDKDSLQDIERRFAMENSLYYFVQLEFVIVGFIRLITNSNKLKARISPIVRLPQFENKGYGKHAIEEIESMFPSTTEWSLDTIKQETKLMNF